MLPYVKDVSVDKILDEERIFMIVEKYNDFKIPAPFISDGTSTIMAILIALYFQDSEIILIEEPERRATSACPPRPNDIAVVPRKHLYCRSFRMDFMYVI